MREARVRIMQSGIDRLERDSKIAEQLEPAAQSILSSARSRAPSWIDAAWYTRHGVGPRGAYAQAIGRGSGIVLAEYGGLRSPAHAMFRSSV